MIDKDYYVGLDMGTASVGWAVTDEEYNLVRAKGKDLWGVRLFPEAKTAEERRTFRISRRRLQREKSRIAFLKEAFEEEIGKVDPGFYQRLDDSKFYEEDKTEKQPFAIFAGSNYTDKDYHKEYPTIFHLRNELIKSKNEHDVRLVYLAILNIFKHRGHFLNASLDGESNVEIEDLSAELKKIVLERYNFELPDNLDEVFKTYLPSKSFSNSRKVDIIVEASGLSKSKNKPIVELIKYTCGLKGKLAVAFKEDNLSEEYAKESLSFRDSTFDEEIAKAEELLTEDSFELLMLLKQIHDWGVLADLMQGENRTYSYLSEARIDLYEKHKKDLSILKKLYKDYRPDAYSSMFRVMDKDNYSGYVGSVNSGKEVERRGVKFSKDDFFKRLKKEVDAMPDSEEKSYVLNEIDKEAFLPKQLTSANGVIPNQLHLAELKAILTNAEEYLSFLCEKDDNGLSVSDRIIQVFSFTIPYYIGPLVNNGSYNTWVVRKEEGKVFPWNFEEKIDSKSSAEKFIDRMVKRCTYLSDESVLPKNSLTYEKFMVLNELNNLKINGKPVPIELKQKLFNELFAKGKKVKAAEIISYLKGNAYVGKKDETVLSGIDGDFTNTLANYAKFASIFETEVLTDKQKKIAEDIIFWSTVYGDSRSFLKEKITEEYGEILSDKQIKRILGIKFKDWGRLSKALLEIEGADKATGAVDTIINRMWNDNYNLMQLLSENFTYREAIEEKAGAIDKNLIEFSYDDLDGLYLSAPVKRMTWQTILILKELYRVLGKMPKKIFVEMARESEGPNATRKDSRKKKFEELYKGNKEFLKEIKETEESKFRSKKLYLYYTQQGRCMYTGERIELSDLFKDNLYDIDHIYPRHFVKDDSIENNLVLVKKQKNADKLDIFPIESEIRNKMGSFWKVLKDGKFITEEKYKRLTRNSAFTDDEKADFISRQLVETRQGTKIIAEILKNAADDIEVIYSKASVVSDFRHKYDLIKCREINDFHHANDAYLNIVVGNAYNVKFTKNPRNFIKEYNSDKEKYEYNMDKIFDRDIARGNQIGWKADGSSLSVVKKTMARNTPLISRMSYEVHGGFADQQIRPAKEAEKADGVGYVPVKGSDARLADTTKYGGFVKYTGAYFFLVEHTLKKERVRTLEAMPLYLADKLNTKEKMERYCIETLGYVAPSIRLSKIKMYSTIKVDGFYLYLSGRTNNRLVVQSATSMVLPYELCKYVKKLAMLGSKDGPFDNTGISEKDNSILYSELMRKYQEGIFVNRPNPVGELISNGKGTFESLDTLEQINVLNQMIQLNNLNSGADLKAIGGVSKTGVMAINKKISDKREFKLINRSATGIFEEEIDLLTI